MYSQIDKNKFFSSVLLLSFVGFVVTLGLLFGYVLTQDLYSSVFLGFVAFLVSMVGSIFTYFFGHIVVLYTTGAIDVSEDPGYQRLNDIVESVSIKAGIPKPKVYVLPERALNAYATGRNPQNGHVAVTQGMIDTFSDEELEAVVAHEIAHIRNYDIRLMLIVSVLAGTITFISDFFLRGMFIRGRIKDEYNGEDRDQLSSPFNILLLSISMIFAILTPIISLILQMAISRRREFLADISAVEITRYPQGLISALRKLAADDTPVQRATEGNAHMFIDFPLKDAGSFIENLFSTHPPIEERIAALEKI